MNCNYKTDKKRHVRCGAPTVDGAKMCPEHQEYMRVYMKKYRARRKAKEESRARKDTLNAIGVLVEELVAAEAKKVPAGTVWIKLPELTDETTPEEAAQMEVELLQAWKGIQAKTQRVLDAIRAKLKV